MNVLEMFGESTQKKKKGIEQIDNFCETQNASLCA